MKSGASTAVYAGTFDPITNGHRDIVERALKVFERVVIAIGRSQKVALFSVDDRLSMIREALSDFGDRVSVEAFDGLLVDFARKVGSNVLIRGLRAVADYEYEGQMGMINRELASDIETIYFVTSKKWSYLSSSIVKQVAEAGGDVAAFVPPNIVPRLKKAIS